LGVGLVFGAWYYFAQVRGATEIALTLTSNPDLEQGLVLHYTFDGPDMDWSSTTAEVRDRSGNGRHANATTTMTSQSSVGPGVLGQALYFDGENNDQVFSRAFDNDSVFGNELSMCTWVQTSSSTKTQVVLTNITHPQLLIRPNNKNFWGKITDGVLISDVSSPEPPLVNTWQHVCVTADDQFINIWIDGVKKQGDATSGDDLSISGSVWEMGGSQFDGALDDVRIYNRALSADEVERLYQLGEGTKFATTVTTNDSLETGLVGHWTFDGPDVDWSSTTAEIKDRSGNGNHGDATSTTQTPYTTLDLAVPGALGQALKFSYSASSTIQMETFPGTFPTNTFTSAFWVKRNGQTAGSIISSAHCNGCSNGRQYRVYWSSGRLRVATSDVSTGEIYELIDDSNADSWQHVTLVFDGAAEKIYSYKNGEFFTEDTASTSINLSSSVYKLALGVPGSFQLPAELMQLDDVRIYNRALSADEVERLYQLGEGTKFATTIKAPSSPLEQGLVGHWTFDGPDVAWDDTTTEIKDVSGNDNHGDAQGGMTAASSPTMGVMGQGMVFAGDTIEDKVTFSEINLGTTHSVSAWIRTSPALCGEGYPAVVGHSGANGGPLELNSTCTGYQYWGWGASGTITFGDVGNDRWQHVAVVREGLVVTAYLDGQYSTSSSLASNVTMYSNQIGARGGSHYGGALDDVRIYNRALSVEEVKRLYQMGQ